VTTVCDRDMSVRKCVKDQSTRQGVAFVRGGGHLS